MRLLFFVLLLISLLTTALPSFSQEQEKQDTPAEQKQSEEKPAAKDSEEGEASEDSNILKQPAAPIKLHENIKPPADFLTQQQQDIKHYLNNDVIKPIMIGPDEHITLITVNKSANNKGVMILLPDWQQKATNTKAINYLRTQMPNSGWTTISIQPTDKPSNYPSRAIKDIARDEENTKVLSEYQNMLGQIISRVSELSTEYPGIVVVIAQGSHASLLVNIYQQSLAPHPAALVLLSSYLPEQKANQLSSQNLAQLPFPVLDLSLRRDHYLVNNAVQMRKTIVNQEMKAFYRQKQLQNIETSYYPEQQMVKEITGWLKSIGW